MGIGNRPDPDEQQNDVPVLNFLQQQMLENVTLLNKARNKYEPLVKSLADMDFAGLFQVVMEERTRRMTRLIIENPIVREHVMNQVAREFEEEERIIKDQEN